MADGSGDNATEPQAALSLKTAKGAGWVIAWRLATRNLGLVSTLVLARLLAPDDFGLVAIATGFIAAVDALSAVGVQDALVREPTLDRDLYDTAFTMNFMRSALTAAVIAVAAWPVAGFFGDLRLMPILLALAIGTLIAGCENIGIVDFQRDLAFHKEFQLQLTGRTVAVVLTIALAVALRSYWALVAGILAARIARLVQSYAMSPYRPWFGLRRWRRIVGFSLWTWAAGLAYMVRDRLESIVIGRLLGAASVGIFAIGVEVGALPTTELVEPLCRALFSGFAEANRTGLSPARVYLRVVAAALLLTVPAAVGISLVAGPMIRLALGPQWLKAVPLVWIIAVPGALSVMSNVSAAVLNAEGLPQLNFHLGALGAVVKAPLLLGLVAAFGLAGGAIAVALSLVIEQALYLTTIRRRLGVRMAELAAGAWRPVVATAIMAAVLVGCGLGWSEAAGGAPAAARALAAAVPLGAATYLVALLGCWLAAGRPDGAETDALRLIRYSLRWLRAPIRLARPAVGS
ncbi:MAG TPA: lipopolysaccharide biosynthesis protein [Stellaceae bacterium]|nr:lipopolysaccharide biosynthesis protein [Stellaceae bacterium]